MSHRALDSFPPNSSTALAALGFDYGTRRIGVAFGQSVSGSARPVTVLKARDGIPDWEQIAVLVEQWSPDIFVVGLPYNLDGSDSELLKQATRFGWRLHGRFHRPVFGMDERLSSHAASEQLQGADKGKAIDDIAARIILQNWFAGWARLDKSGDG